MQKWEEQRSIAEEAATATAVAPSNEKGKQKVLKKKSDDPKPELPSRPIPCMQKDEPRMFLHLATAMKLFMGRSINEEVVKKAQYHLQKYLLYFWQVSLLFLVIISLTLPSQLYGKDAMKLNHHWSMHLQDQVLDYGPVYDFWTFLME